MKRGRRWVTALLAGLAVGCAGVSAPPSKVPPSKVPPAGAPVPAPPADERFAVSLARSACFGRCPQYRVTVHGDGLVEFVGERNVAALGPYRKRVDPLVVAKLLMPARELFGRLMDYVPGSAGCQAYATDHATISLTFSDAGVHRALHHYLGCAKPPDMLIYFEQQLEATANIGAWVQGGALR